MIQRLRLHTYPRILETMILPELKIERTVDAVDYRQVRSTQQSLVRIHIVAAKSWTAAMTL